MTKSLKSWLVLLASMASLVLFAACDSDSSTEVIEDSDEVIDIPNESFFFNISFNENGENICLTFEESKEIEKNEAYYYVEDYNTTFEVESDTDSQLKISGQLQEPANDLNELNWSLEMRKSATHDIMTYLCREEHQKGKFEDNSIFSNYNKLTIKDAKQTEDDGKIKIDFTLQHKGNFIIPKLNINWNTSFKITEEANRRTISYNKGSKVSDIFYEDINEEGYTVIKTEQPLIFDEDAGTIQEGIVVVKLTNGKHVRKKFLLYGEEDKYFRFFKK